MENALVIFQYTAETPLGCRVLLVGDWEQLGNWDPEFAHELTTDGETYPIWRVGISIPLNTMIQYKYVLDRKDELIWEEIKGNRRAEIFAPEMTIEDEQGTNDSKVTIIQGSPLKNLTSKVLMEDSVRYFDESIQFSSNDRVIIASMHLPIKVKKTSEGKWSFDRDYSSWTYPLYEIAMTKGIDFIWIGWPWIFTEDIDEKEDLIQILGEEYNCFPIFIEQKVMETNELFLHSVMFPLFNNVVGTKLQYSPKLMDSYREINSLYSEEIIRQYTGRELVWIHDYQLLYVPVFLSKRAKRENPINIGLVFHKPFPSSDVFRMFPDHEKILNAILVWDLVGFHLYEQCRNFTSSCTRLLSGVKTESVEGGYFGLSYCGRFIMLRVDQLGIEPNLIETDMQDQQYAKFKRKLQDKYKNKKIILGMDKINPLSGVHLKLNAFRKFLRENPTLGSDLMLVQVIQNSRNWSSAISTQLSMQFWNQAEQINKEYGKKVVEIVFSPQISRYERYAYFSIAHAMVVTSIREGLNLEPLEYITCLQNQPGYLIISEFATVSNELSSVIRVNPFDVVGLWSEIQKIVQADDVNVTDEQTRDLELIREKTAEVWAIRYLSDLKRSKKDTDSYQYVPIGFSDKVKIIRFPKNFEKLDLIPFTEDYSNSENRLLLFDNEGTLIRRRKQTEVDDSIDHEIIAGLKQLSEDPKNTVVIITGRMQRYLEDWYGGLTNWVLCAEYGYLIRWKGEQVWERSVNFADSWKEVARATMEQYAMRTQGAVVQEKEHSLVFWHRDTDPEYGNLQAQELVSHLKALLSSFFSECAISTGLGYVEVGMRNVDKGNTLFSILDRVYKEKSKLDFLFTIGDDASDEKMFLAMQQIQSCRLQFDSIDYLSIKAYACVVEMKPSLSKYYVHGPEDVKDIIQTLTGDQDPARHSSKSNSETELIGQTMKSRRIQRNTFSFLENINEEKVSFFDKSTSQFK